MPLTLLVPTVLIGLTLIALALWGLGFAKSAALSTDQVIAEFQADQGRRPDSVELTEDGRAGLIRSEGAQFLAWAFGADIVLHDLAGATLSDGAKGSTIILGDFAAPRVTLKLTPTERARWEEALS